MPTLTRSLSSLVVLGGIFATTTAIAQDGAPPPDPAGGIAPAPVTLDEEAPAPAAPMAQADASASASLGGGFDANAGAATATEDEGPVVVIGTDSAADASVSGPDVGGGGWNLSYHGYLRAPMRIGIGSRDVAPYRTDTNPAGAGELGKDWKETTFHTPLIPDDQYLNWQHTNHNSTDWAEMFFTVGNGPASGTVALQGFSFTNSAWADPEAQFGISQGYVTIAPELPARNMRINVKVGSFWDKYGQAGRYDAGQYDTYLFGRTKNYGERVRFEVDLEDIGLAFEQGFGAKRPNPSKQNSTKFTLLHHYHAFLQWQGLKAGLHFLQALAQEEDRNGVGAITNYAYNPYGRQEGYGYVSRFGEYDGGAEGALGLPDGNMIVAGPEVKYDAGPFGLIYLGYSYIGATNALVVDNAIEVIHADGGGPFGTGITQNYLDNPRCKSVKISNAGGCTSGGNGTIHTIMAEYEFSLANMLQGMEDGTTFWGEGQDFKAYLYMMFNKTSSDYVAANDTLKGVTSSGAPEGDNYSSVTKLKFGTDLQGHLFPNMGVALRYDYVSPNNNLPEQNFMIVSPRLFFKSAWITHELIELSYSRYIYSQRYCTPGTVYEPTDYQNGNTSGSPTNQRCAQYPAAARLPDGWGATAEETGLNRGAPVSGNNPNNVPPDENVIRISASMW